MSMDPTNPPGREWAVFLVPPFDGRQIITTQIAEPNWLAHFAHHTDDYTMATMCGLVSHKQNFLDTWQSRVGPDEHKFCHACLEQLCRRTMARAG